MTQLFTGQTTDASSQAIDFSGGPVMMVVNKVGGTGTIALQMSPNDGTTWLPVDGMSLTADGTKICSHLPRCKLRVNLSSASSANFNVWVGA
jgi:hypothetical protein